MNQMNDWCTKVGYLDVVKYRLLCEFCFVKRCCFPWGDNFFDDDYVDDSFLVM